MGSPPCSLPQPPTAYLSKVYFDSIVFTPHQLEYLVHQYGAHHVLMGTDYPFDMGEYDPVGHVMVTEGLSQAEKSVVAGEAAKSLLGL